MFLGGIEREHWLVKTAWDHLVRLQNFPKN